MIPGAELPPARGHGPRLVVRPRPRHHQPVHPRPDRQALMIDCDIHIQIGDREEFLGFMDPAQRAWFREQGPLLGMPGYTWGHPTGFMRDELELSADGVPGANADLVRREVLDPYDVDVGLLTADDGVRRLGDGKRLPRRRLRPRAQRLAARLLARRRPALPRHHHRPRPGSAGRGRRDPALRRRPALRIVLLCGGSERPYGEPRYLPIFQAAVECGLPVAIHSGMEGMGIAARSGGAGLPTFYIEWHTLGSACSIMAHLVSLVCHGTFERVAGPQGAPDGGRPRLASRHHVAPGHELAGPARRGAVARPPAQRDRARPHALHHPAAGAHRRQRRAALRRMLEAVGAPDILCFSLATTRTGTSTTRPDARAGCRTSWRDDGDARQRRRAVRLAAGPGGGAIAVARRGRRRASSTPTA